MTATTPRTVLVAMSGGVDSSVAAAVLAEAGHRVIGVTMKTFCYEGTPTHAQTCCGLDGIRDARAVCDRLGVPHYVFDMEGSFTRDVIEDFVGEYVAGRTPNPCVRCNSNTKIPDLLRRGRQLGADAIATGHYATRIGSLEEGRIGRGVDQDKDQSYFLWGVPPEVAAALWFPVGHLTKAEVRRHARALDLETADKPESQDICFVPTGDYTDLLADRLGRGHPALEPGELVDTTGAVVGSHGGYGRYTVGQRRGLGGGFASPVYVLRVLPEENRVVVGSAEELLRDELELGDTSWLAAPPVPGEEVLVQLRHRAKPVPCEVLAVGPGTARLRLARPQRAVTPGQSGVLYRAPELVGGGRIR